MITVNPTITDNDKGTVHVTYRGHKVRSWLYASDDERRLKTRLAHEYVEGWVDGYRKRRHEYHEQRISEMNAEVLAKQTIE